MINFPTEESDISWVNHGDGEAVVVGLASSVTVSLFCFARSRTRETAGINKPIRMAIIAITTNNSISVKALTRSRRFAKVDVEEVLFDFIGNRCGGRLPNFHRTSQ